jgi:transposase
MSTTYLGVDAHKAVHVAVALDGAGQLLGEWSGPNSAAGWEELATWAHSWGAHRQWGIEGAWGYGRGLAQYLVVRGEGVCEINTRWTAAERKRARNRSKSDVRDAQAIALYLWREGATLPRVGADDASAVLAVLVTQRDAAVAEATQVRNQAHHLLLQLDPTYRSHLPGLTTPAGIAALEQYQPLGTDPLTDARASALRLLGQRLRLATAHAEQLQEQIEAQARQSCAPLIRLKGVNALTAGMLAAHLGPGRRFRTDADLALYAGVAPLEVSSAGRVRHRLNRGGNRQLNAILYRIALTQLRCWPPAQDYVARRMSEGKTKLEAIRALKRHLVRVIWRLWGECVPASADDPRPATSGPVSPEARPAPSPRASGGAAA